KVIWKTGTINKKSHSETDILFKGAASVINGSWTFTFVVPKDIDYNFGIGKISYYAHDGVQDATGAYCDIIIGGTAANPIEDDTPPLVEVFMDNEDFVFGGITTPKPVLLVKLSDDYGINVAGTGIGHDLTAVIDDNNLNTLVLNDFYESEINNPRKGTARYPLSGIEPGLHTVRVKGWDIANNSGEGYTEFVVADDAEGALAHVLNYPNPFTTHTEFQFEHNYKGQAIRVQVQVFTVSGKLVKTISKEIIPQGHRVTGIEWDGTDDYGDKIGRGVYLYKVKVGNISDGNANNTTNSDFEKLVILR
ncbi:MAG: FlgD immunoglobulin-like domain containing protein, partial [Saprospiraceae bacterium]